MAANSEVRSIASERIFDYLYDKAQLAQERWIQENGVDTRYTDNNVPVKVAEGLRADATEEFLEDYSETTEDTVVDDAREYVDENYDNDFMFQQIERKQDVDEILDLQRDDLCLFLENMEPYQNVDRSYWLSSSRAITDIKEMQSYLSEDGATVFVERYAPDWKEAMA